MGQDGDEHLGAFWAETAGDTSEFPSGKPNPAWKLRGESRLCGTLSPEFVYLIKAAREV